MLITFLLFLLALGFVFGFISSTPLGPINLLVAENYLSKPKIKIKPFLFGVIVTDALFAYIAFWGYYKYIESSSWGKGIAIVGGAFILLLGVIGLFQAKQKNSSTKEKNKILDHFRNSNSANVFKGFFLCGSNPGFIMYWAGVASIIKELVVDYYPLQTLESSYLILFCLGIVLGDFVWFGVFIALLKKGAKKFSDALLEKIRFVISIGLVLLGLYTLFFLV